MKKLLLLLLAPSLAFAQIQVTGKQIQIGGNVPNVTDINGSSGSFTFTGDGGCGRRRLVRSPSASAVRSGAWPLGWGCRTGAAVLP